MPDPLTSKNLPTPCLEFEDLILDYFDHALGESEKRKVEGHIAECRPCAAFWNEQRDLDSVLSATFLAPRLRPDFKNTLLRQIAAETATLDREQALVDKRLKQGLRRRTAFAVLDMVGYLAVGVVVGLVGQELAGRIPVSALILPKDFSIYAAWGSVALCLAFTSWYGLKREFRAAGLGR